MALHATDHLIEEHRLILRAVYVLQAMGERARAYALPDPTDVERLLRFFRRFAQEHHQSKEEIILFPALRNTSLGTKGPLRRLMFEHEQEQFMFEGLEQALQMRNSGDFAYFAGRMAHMLTDHIYEEDNILFECVEKAITADLDCKLVEEMIAFDQRQPSGLLDRFVEIVEQLESKYLMKHKDARLTSS